jgi:hypothetical protein
VHLLLDGAVLALEAGAPRLPFVGVVNALCALSRAAPAAGSVSAALVKISLSPGWGGGGVQGALAFTFLILHSAQAALMGLRLREERSSDSSPTSRPPTMPGGLGRSCRLLLEAMAEPQPRECK